MARVELRGVKKSFGSREIVKGIDLSIADGEFMVLIGPSGCGKSTILRMIAGLEEISEGLLLLDGKPCNNLTPRERDVAMVFQNYALYPHMDVRDNLAFGLKVRGMPKAEIDRLVRDTAAMLGIESLLHYFPRQLSGGQRQRVAMGRAIVRRPRVFLFDEPLSNLDATLRGQLRVELKRLHQQLRATVIYVTHDHVEAMTLADRIALLHEGVIQQVGTPAEVFNSPANRFVAGFIGSPKMNFFEGIVSTSQPGRIEGEKFIVPLTPQMEKKLESWKGKRVEIGVRPQHLSLVGNGRGGGREVDGLRRVAKGSEPMPLQDRAIFSGILEVMEPLGWETYLHIRINEVVAVAQVESHEAASLKVGAAVELVSAPEKIHVFSLEGISLLYGGEMAAYATAKEERHVPPR